MAILVFEKTVVIKVDTVNFPADGSAPFTTLIRPFTDLIVKSTSTDNPPKVSDFDPAQITLSYNGQELGTTATSKYYYSVAPAPTSPSTATLTGFTLTIQANSSYEAPGYSVPTNIAASIGTSDLFFLNYTYTIITS